MKLLFVISYFERELLSVSCVKQTFIISLNLRTIGFYVTGNTTIGSDDKFNNSVDFHEAFMVSVFCVFI